MRARNKPRWMLFRKNSAQSRQQQIFDWMSVGVETKEMTLKIQASVEFFVAFER